MASSKRPLVYGGGGRGIMGVVSGAVLDEGGKVTGIIPYAIHALGGEEEKGNGPKSEYVAEALDEKRRAPVRNSITHDATRTLTQATPTFR